MVKLTSTYRQMLADTYTPVSIYLKLRDKYCGSIMLESSDYHGHENSFSYICCDSISSFEVEKGVLNLKWPDGTVEKKDVGRDVISELDSFKNSFEVKHFDFQFIQNGLFGYMSYDAVQYYEDITFKNTDSVIPDIRYQLFKYVIAIDHFKNQLYVFEHLPEGHKSEIDQFVSIIKQGSHPVYNFNITTEESSNLTDDEFLGIVGKCIDHCNRGDVFQIVPSRRFENRFSGDEFNVYRALRSVNPSPYLFYFDYGNYKIFGSSPEAQIVIKEGEASIHPIAGTFKRTGDDTSDKKLADDLIKDEKENSEHVMLVDLARNDLSINSDHVTVDIFKEVQYYSHVIHLVSKVTGKLREEVSPLQLVADTFPAGTLSGAPKHKAMQLIDKYENTSRSYYGGAIGYLGFNNDFNHAIMIRSFLSMNNTLIYQAGAGIESKSSPESELKEVNNKLMALRRAMELAEQTES